MTSSIPPVSIVHTTRWSDQKLVRKEVKFRVQREVLYSSSQYSTTRWSDQKLVRKEVRLRAQREVLYSSSQYSTHHKAVGSKGL